tara:strand:+ start:37928 stop:40330 length:2403 start_codon:yes stop_codon:yes gene_type:complete
MPDEDVIPVHKAAWTKRETLQRILSRYCHVLEDVGGRSPTYLVSEKENEDMHEVLIDINSHLSKLGYNARLYPDDPWILQLISDPKMQWPSPRFVVAMWAFSLLTTVFAGEKWMSSARPEGGWFVKNATFDAFVGYTVPIFSCLIIASLVQKFVAKKRGVHLPHLFPIPGPALVWWPFGMVGFASLPRSDARLWPDRSALGNAAISAPLVLIIAGIFLSLCGIYLTPDVVSITAAPLALELPLIIQLIGLSLENEVGLILKTSWAHPFTRVGMTLTFVGWVSLLPIPTFPGGRVLIARMGIPEARSGSTQVMLLLVILLFAFLYGAFSQWSIWVLVIALCGSLLISRGGDPRLPIVLDDFKGLPEKDHFRLGVILFVAFLAALPAQIPFYEDDNWKDEITYEIGDESLVIEEGWFNQTVKVSNPSLIVQVWKVTAVDFNSDDYSLDYNSIECDKGSRLNNSCSGEINPKETIELEFNFQWTSSWNPSTFDLLWNVEINTEQEIIKNSVRPDTDFYPLGNWKFNDDLDDPKSCIELNDVPDSKLNLSAAPENTYWDDIDANGTVSVEINNPEICLNALSGDNMYYLSEYQFSINNETFNTGLTQNRFVAIPSGGVILDSNELMFSNSVLAYNYDKDNCLEIMNEPDFDSPGTEEGESKWNMSIVHKARNDPSVTQNKTRLLVPSGSTITDCEEVNRPKLYLVKEGPSLILNSSGHRTQHWIGTVEIQNGTLIFENPSDSDVELNIEFDGNGKQWNVSNDITITGGQVTEIPVAPPETGISFSWLELDDEGKVILHLVNHEV